MKITAKEIAERVARNGSYKLRGIGEIVTHIYRINGKVKVDVSIIPSRAFKKNVKEAVIKLIESGELTLEDDGIEEEDEIIDEIIDDEGE